MAKADSKGAAAPSKPYESFPLYFHKAGYWAKMVRGKRHYFGPRHGTWQEALEDYERLRPSLERGRDPKADPNATTMRELCNQFLTSKKAKLETGELSQRSFDDYHKTCSRLLDAFGKTRAVMSLDPMDFLELRKKWAENWGPVTLGNEIRRAQIVFRFALKNALISREVCYGTNFDLPSRRIVRLHRNEKGPRMFTPAQIHDLIAAADPQMQAMILLGVNAGLGNRDCGMLTTDRIDFKRGWLTYPRLKTGAHRRAKLWPETVTAIKNAMSHRYEPASPDLENVVFITRRGNRWCAMKGKADPISRAFRELLDKLKIRQPGLSFYSLRHNFATVAGDTADQVAVNYVMGHVDSSMAGHYRQTVFDPRLEAVSDHVHAWLYGGRES